MPAEKSTHLQGLDGYPKLKGLLDFWRKLAGRRAMPTRLDLDPLGLKPWLGNLLLVEVSRPSSFRYRVYGTKVEELLGHDFNGRDIQDLPQPHRAEAFEDYRAVVESRAPHFVERERLVQVTHAFDPKPLVIGKLSLPFSADGQNVNQILAAIYPRK